MSGRAKRIIYNVCDWTLWAIAIVGAILLAFFTIPDVGAFEIVAFVAIILCVLLRVPAALHECGHLLFGALAGLRFHAVTLAYFRFERGKQIRFTGTQDAAAGATEMYPKSGKGVRGRMIAFALGGATTNLVFGLTMLLIYLVLLPFYYHAAFLFFAILALFSLHEGIRALIPAELPAGKTDGEVLVGFIKKERDEVVALKVLTAQGILYRNEFSAIPRELLFEAPVVREDLPAFAALLLLRAQYLLASGEDDAAKEQLARLAALEDLPDEYSNEVTRYDAFFTGKFAPKEEALYGVRKLGEGLAARQKNSADEAE